MCGISGIIGHNWETESLKKMLAVQHHRGPDAQDMYISEDHYAGLAHNRLSIIDLSEAGKQPMKDATGRYYIIFNGEVYNYLEIKAKLAPEFTFRTNTDTEVVLNAYLKWGAACLDKFIGMFSFVIWDEKEKSLWAARDRLGVKPFNYAFDNKGNFLFASEIKTLHAGGIAPEPDNSVWAEYLGYGRYDNDERSFWKGVSKLMAGHTLTYQNGSLKINRWYYLPDHTGFEYDTRNIDDVVEEYLALLKENIKFRFRADVPVGINLSGGLDSSALLALVDTLQGHESQVNAYTFITNDDRYDELHWVNQMIAKTKHPLVSCLLEAKDIPELAASVQYYQDEPYGGIPTLAYARLFEIARQQGVIVLLDGQGMDEQWAGYDYYRNATTSLAAPTVQGTTDSPVRPECLNPDFLATAQGWKAPEVFPDKLRNLQYRDAFYTKIPRALRFNDRISMRASTELREPFLDHRAFELAFKQNPDYKIKGDQGKYFMRHLLNQYLPGNIVEAPKRALQTPQREWLKEDLRDWMEDEVNQMLNRYGDEFFNAAKVKETVNKFIAGESDNSFYIWQWISFNMLAKKTMQTIS